MPPGWRSFHRLREKNQEVPACRCKQITMQFTQTRRRSPRLEFRPHLTDAAGGNISVRVDDPRSVSPRHSGSRRHWQLQTNQVLVSDMHGNKSEGDGDVSRRSRCITGSTRNSRMPGLSSIPMRAT